MKLEQIILEYQFPEIKYRKIGKLPTQYHHGADVLRRGPTHLYKRDYSPRAMRSKGVEHMGTGMFSSVYSHEDRPHDVRKVSRHLNASKLDGFFYFLKALEQHPDENTNPYFPRIRSVTVYESPHADAVYTAQMERLFPLSSLNPEQVDHLWRKAFGEVPEDDDRAGGAGDLISDIREIMLGGIKMSDWKKTDRDLLKAIRFIREVASEYQVGIDLHVGNVMVRHTPYGPQLVLTDPLGFRIKDEPWR